MINSVIWLDLCNLFLIFDESKSLKNTFPGLKLASTLNVIHSEVMHWFLDPQTNFLSAKTVFRQTERTNLQNESIGLYGKEEYNK